MPPSTVAEAARTLVRVDEKPRPGGRDLFRDGSVAAAPVSVCEPARCGRGGRGEAALQPDQPDQEAARGGLDRNVDGETWDHRGPTKIVPTESPVEKRALPARLDLLRCYLRVECLGACRWCTASEPTEAIGLQPNSGKLDPRQRSPRVAFAMTAGPYRRGRDHTLIPTASTSRTGGDPRDSGVVEPPESRSATTLVIAETIVVRSAPAIPDFPGMIISRRDLGSGPSPPAGRVSTSRPHSWEQPSDSRPAAPISLDTLGASVRRPSAGDA